jgi:hypothetical protein
MLVVRVELHSAITGKVSEIARMHVCNVGGTETHGDYRARVLRFPKFMHQTRDSSVTNYRRLARPVWDLVTLALKKAGYGK